MPRLTPADELFVHQIPEPLPHVVTPHDHWRESYFFVMHPKDPAGDVVILTMAHFPRQETMDSLQMGRIGGRHVFGRHARPYDGDPHTTVVGPATIEILEAYRRVHLLVDEDPAAPVSLDIVFEARTAPYGLRRGTMKYRDEIIWDQSHMIQSGTFSGWFRQGETTYEVDGWTGQRDHSWGIRDHRRCPMWMWLALQFDDGMLGVWHWEYADGARVYTDGCWAPTGDADPIPVVDFRHDLQWTGEGGGVVDYGDSGTGVTGLAGRVEVTLQDGQRLVVEGSGSWAAPYGPVGGGQHLMAVHTDDGRAGFGVYEVTGAHHHRFFPIPRADKLPPG